MLKLKVLVLFHKNFVNSHVQLWAYCLSRMHYLCCKAGADLKCMIGHFNTPSKEVQSTFNLLLLQFPSLKNFTQ